MGESGATAFVAQRERQAQFAAFIKNLLLHNAETLELDSAGRVLLPQNLRRLVNFDKDVMLVGRVNRLDFGAWNKKWQKPKKPCLLTPMSWILI